MVDAKWITQDLSKVIGGRMRPAVTFWNRLEGRPRTENFTRAMQAEIRDPLWMLTRQWQMGEFRGDDAGSPFFAKAHVETTRMAKYQPAQGPVEPLDLEKPLEPQVERLPLRFDHGPPDDTVPVSLDLRLVMGRYWLKLVSPLAPAAAAQFISQYPVDAPDPDDKRHAIITAHPQAWSSFSLAAGRMMDGYKLARHIRGGGSVSLGIAALTGLEAQADALATRFLTWFARLIQQPEEDNAWLPERLEYQFSTSAPTATGEKVLKAEQYHQGHLDWHSFDVDPTRDALDAAAPQPAAPHTLTMIPTNVTFNGMPNTRWWKFEDSVTSFGDIKPDTTDLAKLLLIEFGLVYGNDWFIIPFTLPAGTIANVRGIAVTNVFGERIWVEAAGRGPDDAWQRWAMYLLSTMGRNGEPADLSLVIPPVTVQLTEGQPREAIMIARDEMANMVWAVEKTICLPNGDARLGHDATTETQGWFTSRVGGLPSADPDYVADIRYKVMSSVPENWIPFVSAHVPGNVRETQLQRASMLRIIPGDPDQPVPVEPRTALLRPGLDSAPRAPYFVHEEEVPRAGIEVTTSFQRTRSRNGEALVWLGARKRTGRGEGSSGLAFDRIVPRTG
jgi:hypothetical protein